jgi:hypothetical protein
LKKLEHKRFYEKKCDLRRITGGETYAFDVAHEDHTVGTVFAKGGGTLH